MNADELWETVAVLPMRMQTEDLAPDVHPGHWAMVAEAAEKHRDVLIVLGVPRTYELEDNPLNYEIRRQMVLNAVSAFPKNTFRVIQSESRNVDYATRSRLFDEMIEALYPDRTVLPYGARESFIDKYTGKFPVHRVETTYFGSGTALREQIKIRHTRDFRAGIIWTKQNQRSMGFPAIDVLIANRNTNRLILVRKHDENGWRFPGVLFDPDRDESYEGAAARCIKKEVPTVSTTSPFVVQSLKIDDWRLKRSRHKIITMLCSAAYSSGDPSPGAGLGEARWFDRSDFCDSLVEEHRPLGQIAHSRFFG